MHFRGQQRTVALTPTGFDEHKLLDAAPRPVVAVAVDYPRGYLIEWHAHRRHQLVYCADGILTVRTGDRVWVAPPHRGVWIKAGTWHSVKVEIASTMRTIYVAPGSWPQLPERSCAVSISPLLRELIMEAIALPKLYDQSGSDGRLIEVLVERIASIETSPLHLPLPADRRLLAVCNEILDRPGEPVGRLELSARLGVSPKTLLRLFQRETGMSFKTWRLQAKLYASLIYLAEGRSVTTVSYDLGFHSQSAFIATFKRTFGQTPGRFFKN